MLGRASRRCYRLHVCIGMGGEGVGVLRRGGWGVVCCLCVYLGFR